MHGFPSPLDSDSSRSRSRQRVDFSHLKRLPPQWYRGNAYVHWIATVRDRGKGWLTPEFHAQFREVMIHACSCHQLACPTYALMPDHAHILWIGLGPKSDQLPAIEFLRAKLRPSLQPFDWQKQAYDHVLTEAEREHGAFAKVAQYILDNPVRGELVEDWRTYPYSGACMPGYPEFDPRMQDYWERFWRCYAYRAERESQRR